MPKTAAKEPYCALYPFRAADKQDICLRPGDKLYVFDARDDNWWFVSDLTVVSPILNLPIGPKRRSAEANGLLPRQVCDEN